MKVRYFLKREHIWLDFMDATGKRRRIPTTAKTEDHARLLAPAVIAAALLDSPATVRVPASKPVPPKGMTLQQAFDKACKHRDKWIDSKDKQTKLLTFASITNPSGSLTRVPADADCSILTRTYVQDLRAAWRTEPGKRAGTLLSNSTINHRLSMLSVLLDVADLPGHTVKHLSVVKSRRQRRVREDELQAIVSWCHAQHTRKGATTLADLIMVGINTTARQGELLGLLWKDVYWDTGTVIYRDPKNGETRSGILTDAAKRILERRLTYGSLGPFLDLTKSQANTLWAAGRKALGLEDDHEFVFHVATRHEGLSRLGDAGRSTFIIKAFSGHKSIAAADRYVKPELEALREAGNDITRAPVAAPTPTQLRDAH